MRTQTVILTVMSAMVAALVAVGVWMLWQSYSDADAEVRLRAKSGAQVVSVNIEWALETARQVLRRVDGTIADPEDALPPTAAGDISEAVASIPGRPKIYVVDAAGQTILTTDKEYRSVDITDREYFQKAKAGEPYWVSSLLISRQNGDHIFTISKRMERNGRFAGVIVLSLTHSLLEGVWSSLALDPQSTVGLIRDDGWLVSRFPKPDGPLDLSKYVLFTDYLPAAPEGTYDTVSPADGVARLVAYRRVPGSNLVALASIALDPVRAEIASKVLSQVLVGLPILLILLVVMVWVARLLKSDARQRKALEAAIKHNGLLMREIHHRVKNHLTSVVALVNISGLKPEEKAELADRVSAMASLYASTYEHGDKFDSLDVADYVPRIVDGIAKAHGKDVTITYDLASLELDAEKAMPLALIVNEVVTNAFKYAFTDGKAGRLNVTLTKAGEEAVLSISDNGAGYDAETSRKGTGSRLIRGFEAKLEGTHQIISKGGTTFMLTFRPASTHSSD